MNAVVEESPDLRQEQRIEQLETDSRIFQNKINKSVDDLNQKLHALGVKVGTIEGSLQRSAPHPWITPVIAIVGSGILIFWGWMAITIVQHGNTLSSIRQSLLGLG